MPGFGAHSWAIENAFIGRLLYQRQGARLPLFHTQKPRAACHPEHSEGSVYSKCLGKNRSFAMLRMTRCPWLLLLWIRKNTPEPGENPGKSFFNPSNPDSIPSPISQQSTSLRPVLFPQSAPRNKCRLPDRQSGFRGWFRLPKPLHCVVRTAFGRQDQQY